MALDTETVGLFIAFVVPGFVSISVYRLIMPNRGGDKSSALLQALSYSSLNFTIPDVLGGYWGGRSYAGSSPPAVGQHRTELGESDLEDALRNLRKEQERLREEKSQGG